ncbi:hypothetical protein V6Z11_A05G093500 [Gossypium hirsutum]
MNSKLESFMGDFWYTATTSIRLGTLQKETKRRLG